MTVTEKQSTPEAAAWWAGLDAYERSAVVGWLVANEPPREWQGTLVDYAHTKMQHVVEAVRSLRGSR